MTPPRSFSYGSLAQRYCQVGTSTSVDSASPHRLIELLFDALVESMSLARQAIRNQKIESKSKAINRAVSILLQGLKGGLDLEAGGALARHLDMLYTYIALRLTQANIRNDVAAIEEGLRLIEPVREAWRAIGLTQVVTGKASA